MPSNHKICFLLLGRNFPIEGHMCEVWGSTMMPLKVKVEFQHHRALATGTKRLGVKVKSRFHLRKARADLAGHDSLILLPQSPPK